MTASAHRVTDDRPLDGYPYARPRRPFPLDELPRGLRRAVERSSPRLNRAEDPHAGISRWAITLTLPDADARAADWRTEAAVILEMAELLCAPGAYLAIDMTAKGAPHLHGEIIGHRLDVDAICSWWVATHPGACHDCQLAKPVRDAGWVAYTLAPLPDAPRRVDDAQAVGAAKPAIGRVTRQATPGVSELPPAPPKRRKRSSERMRS